MRSLAKVSRDSLACDYPFVHKTIVDACATHTRCLLLRLRLSCSSAMKSNVLLAPKAPAISPNAAALLSVCFKLHTPPPLLLFSSNRPACIETPLKAKLTSKSAGNICLHLRAPLLLVGRDTTVANAYSRCAFIDTRPHSIGDVFHHTLLDHYCICAI